MLNQMKKKKTIKLLIVSAISILAVISTLVMNVFDIRDRVFIKKAIDRTESVTESVKEYIFANQYFYLTVITNDIDNVLAYGVTTRMDDFNPFFSVLENNNEIKNSKIILGKTHFDEFNFEPSKINAFLGARRFNYQEEYYFGNPGYYQSYFLGMNDSGFVNIDNSNLEFSLNKEISLEDKDVIQFRQNSVVNTFFETQPFFNKDPLLLMGPDLDQIRVLSEKSIETEESVPSLIDKIENLSTEVNIKFYIDRFGDPLIINNIILDKNGSILE